MTKHLNERINQYDDLARSTNEVRKCLMKSAVTHWRMGYENMAEWHEEISDEFFEFGSFYEGKPLKASKELREIIDPLTL